jgi:hypothetical protein
LGQLFRPLGRSQSYDFEIYNYNASAEVGQSVFQSRRKNFFQNGIVNFSSTFQLSLDGLDVEDVIQVLDLAEQYDQDKLKVFT